MKQLSFLPKVAGRQVVLLAGGLLLFAGCKKDKTDKEPGWYQSPADYIYDAEDSLGNKESVTQLGTFFEQADPNNFLFLENSPDLNNPAGRHYFNLDQYLFTTTSEGLQGEAATSCNVGPLYSRFTFLSVPAKPVTGSTFPQYSCGRSLDGRYTVVQTDTSVTVPAGTFQTFVLVDEDQNRSWWNKETGLVMYQTHNFDSNSQPVGKPITLRLRKIINR